MSDPTTPPDSGDGWQPPPSNPSYQQPPGPPQAGYPQAGGYGPYGYQMPVDHPQGTTILVLGILSIVLCGLLAPVAWIMGSNALKEIDANPGRYGNRSNVQIGRIIGMVYTILMIVVIVAFIALLVVVAASSTGSGY